MGRLDLQWARLGVVFMNSCNLFHFLLNGLAWL